MQEINNNISNIKDFLVDEISKILYEDSCDCCSAQYINNIDELHDVALRVIIGDSYIEDYDMLYWGMCSLINQEGDDMIDEVNNFIDTHCEVYYGDPAFPSASSYWNYILG